MGYTLGIDLGTTFSAAAVHSDGRTQVITLGYRDTVVPSAVYVAEDGSTVLGTAALRRGAAEPERLARQFKRRVGDSVPLILGGMPLTAELLTARLLAWIVAEVTAQRGEPPAAIAVTHPANWGAFKRERLDDIVRQAEVDGVITLTEPEAAAISYAAAERVPAGDVVAVYDLGGGTFDASVLRKTPDGFEVLGTPSGVEHLGGIDVDEAVLAHVTQVLGVELTSLGDDETTRRAVARLRADCVEAKEALSADTQATISVVLPGLHHEVRITRAELEAMVRPLLEQSAAALRRAVTSAGLTAADVDRVLLVGGGSRMPLVAELVGEALGRPVFVDAHPKHATALGAALAAQAHLDANDEAKDTVVAPSEQPPVQPLAPAAPAGPSAAPATAPMPIGSWAPPSPAPAAPQPTAPGGAPAVVGSRRVPLMVGVAVAAVLAVVAVALANGGGDDDPPANASADQPADGGTATSAETVTDGETTTSASTTTTTAPPSTTTTTRPSPVALQIAGASASTSAPDGFDACQSPTSFGATNVIDGQSETAWRAEGDGTGHELTLDLGSERRVLEVGLAPGYDKVDPCDGTDRWGQNRRPTRVTWIFDDGTTAAQTLSDTREKQTIEVDATSRNVRLRIDAVTPNPERDFTAISEATIRGA
jgi:molecular chaperone DnaK